MKIGDCMKRKVIYSTPETTIQDAARLLVQYHIGCLPIVNDDCRLIGLVRIRISSLW
jgi:CBS domain-containing protein